MAKIKITSRKYGGDDCYSWAIFRSDRKQPCFTGLGRDEISYYKRLTQKNIDKEKGEI